MKYFENCNTAKELRVRYKELAKKLYPRLDGADDTEFKAMAAEYEECLKTLIDKERKKSQMKDPELMELFQLLSEWYKKHNPEKYEVVTRFLNNPFAALVMNSKLIPDDIQNILKRF